MDRKALLEILEWKINEMAQNRGIELTKIKHKIDVLWIPMDHYGSVISALVYIPTQKE